MSNKKALALYEKLGFMRVEKLGRYYLNGGDAYRLKFFVAKPEAPEQTQGPVHAEHGQNDDTHTT